MRRQTKQAASQPRTSVGNGLRSLAWLGLCSAMSGSVGCGSANPVVSVSLQGEPPAQAMIQFRARLDGAPIGPGGLAGQSGRSASRQYILDKGQTGSLVIEARVLNGSGCATAGGDVQVDITDNKPYELTVPLKSYAPALCAVAIEKVGPGEIISNPTGLNCGQQCIFDVPTGTTVLLRSKGSAGVVFQGWSGACAGTSDCSLLVQSPVLAEARFVPYVCRGTDYCWESPEGFAADLTGVWGAAKDDVWMTGRQGLLLHWDGKKLGIVPSGTASPLLSIHGSSASDVWAVGSNGTVLHNGGTQWVPMPVPIAPTAPWNVVRARSPSDVWVASNNGVMAHYNGTDWATVALPIISPVTGMTLVGPGRAVVTTSGGSVMVGTRQGFMTVTNLAGTYYGVDGASESALMLSRSDGQLVRWDGTAPQGIPSGSPKPLLAVQSVGGTEAWVVGRDRGIYHFDGQRLARQTTDAQQDLTALYAVASDDVWAVGLLGTIVHYDGTKWQSLSRSPGGTPQINDIGGVSPSDLWAVGESGLVLRETGSGWQRMASPEPGIAWYSVYANRADDVYLLGVGALNVPKAYRWNGASFVQLSTYGSINSSTKLTGTPSGQIVSNYLNQVIALNGTAFSPLFSAMMTVTSIAAISNTEIWVAGPSYGVAPATMLGLQRFNGSVVSSPSIAIPSTTNLRFVRAVKPGDIWVASDSSKALWHVINGLQVVGNIDLAPLMSAHGITTLSAMGVKSTGEVWLSGANQFLARVAPSGPIGAVEVGLGPPLTLPNQIAASSLTLQGLLTFDSEVLVGGSGRTLLRSRQ